VGILEFEFSKLSISVATEEELPVMANPTLKRLKLTENPALMISEKSI